MRERGNMDNAKIWEIKTCDYQLARDLSQKLGLSPLMAELLLQRGIYTCEEAHYFLNAGLDDLQSPFSLTDMEPAVTRIRQAALQGEKIAIYGDYDVDGICSMTMLKQCLDRLGAIAEYYVPDRFSEGYGLNRQAVETIAGQGFKLLITVDCGITAVSETQTAQSLGMDVIISDHHTPAAQLPSALAVINPKLDSTEELKDLCGAGVAFKLCQALFPDWALDKDSGWLELAALATVADVVPLKGENRILVKYGLLRLPATVNCGLQALLKESGLTGKKLSSWHIGFVLAPRLNSAGRLQSARSSVELLLNQNAEQATELAAQLCRLNNERKMIEETVHKEALLQVEREIDLEKSQVLVLGGEGWHQGVTGIVASRLCEKYRRPVIMISWEGEQGRGSCRSLPGLDIYQALSACSSHLLQFGGHRAAAGLSIHRDSLDSFRQALEQWAKDNGQGEEPRARTVADAELEPDDINERLLQELEKLEPFGEGNPSPSFAVRGVEVDAAALLGRKNEHFRARLEPGGVDIIAFNHSDLIKHPLDTCLQDIMFEPGINEFRGIRRVQLKINDMKSSCRPDDKGLVNESGQKLLQAIQKSIAEVYGGRPVLFIFPTYRSLVKYKLMLLSFLRRSLLKEIHGHINRRERRDLMNELVQGQNRLFLVTTAFDHYYRRNCRPPEKLSYVFTFYPDQPDREMQEYYKNCSLISLQADSQPRIKTGKADFDPERRVLLYANRNTTLQAFAGRDSLKVEAGIGDIRQRKVIRRHFMQSGGILLSDGASTGVTGLGDTDVFFADAPYSLYEAQMVMNQLAAGEDREATILFKRDDLEFNRQYLERCYPGTELLKGVLSYFKTRRYHPLTAGIDRLSSAIGAYLQRDFKPADLVGVLDSIADLDLCDFTKKGSIMAIKFIRPGNSRVDLRNSLYYLEGQVEKKEFSRWERNLNNILSW